MKELKDMLTDSLPEKPDTASRDALGYLTGIIVIALTILRSIPWFESPRFWAEDGSLWYSQASSFGISVFLKPAEGYYQLSSRLVGQFSTLFPVRDAPLVFIVR
jgi:hypothetical protein